MLRMEYDQKIVAGATTMRLGDFEQDTYHRGYTDGYEKGQRDIRVIKQMMLDRISTLLKEPNYYHEGEDWQVGLIMAEDVINKFM